jgi:hypothetical protein
MTRKFGRDILSECDADAIKIWLNSEEEIAVAKERAARWAERDIKAGKYRIFCYDKPWPADKPFIDLATGYRVETARDYDGSKSCAARYDSYNNAMRAYHAKNKAAPAP